jgi:hypothetical protein
MRRSLDIPAHRVMALAGLVLAGADLVGVIVYPRAAVVLFFLIVFGLSALPRAVGE